MEKYHTIPTFKKYEITRSGVIRKKDSKRVKSQYVGSTGYNMVSLNDENGKSKPRRVHRLIAITFIPNPENKKYINHINGNKLDNRIENLEWCTMAENNQHGFETGLINNTGVNNGRAKLNPEKVKNIKHLLSDSNLSQQKIADIHNVSRSCILKIHLGKTWQHV